MEKTSPRARHLLSRMVLSLLALVILLPVVMTAIYSFFSPAEIKAFMGTRGSYDASAFMQIKLAPSMFSLSQYYNILIEDMTILRYFVNSAMYAAAILLGQALLIPMMAYALSRFRFPGRDAIFFLVIMLMLLPFQVTMVPNVLTLRTLGLLDTAWAVILPMTVAPFYVFLLRQYMVSLPGDMLEAAQIDGATKGQQIRYITLPMLTGMICILLLLGLGGIMHSNTGLHYQVTKNVGLLYSTTQTIDAFILNALTSGTSNFGMNAAVTFFQSVVGCVMVVATNLIVRRWDPDKALF